MLLFGIPVYARVQPEDTEKPVVVTVTEAEANSNGSYHDHCSPGISVHHANSAALTILAQSSST